MNDCERAGPVADAPPPVVYSSDSGGVLPARTAMTEQQALRVIERYYRNDSEGLESDRQITLERGETIQQWAESLLDPLT